MKEVPTGTNLGHACLDSTTVSDSMMHIRETQSVDLVRKEQSEHRYEKQDLSGHRRHRWYR